MKTQLFALILFCGMLLAASEAKNIILQNQDMRLVFQDAAQGFGCIGIDNLQKGVAFLAPHDQAHLWRISLRAGNTPDAEVIQVDNTTPGVRSYTCTTVDGMQELTLRWSELALPDFGGTIDVVCTIKMPQKNGGAVWTLQADLHSDRFAFANSVFPYIDRLAESGSYDLLFPRLTFGSRYLVNHTGAIDGAYPGLGANIGYLGIFRASPKGGFYLGIEDETAALKTIAVDAEQNLLVSVNAENAGVVQQSSLVSYSFVTTPIATPWQAGGLYRQFAEKQTWMQKGKLADRTDINPAIAEIDVWSIIYGPPEEMLKVYRTLKQDLPGKLVVHWYCWNLHRFDTHYPENLPALPGFEAAVKEVVANGDIVMPYINGHLWDRALPSYAAEGERAAIKTLAGEATVEEWGSGAVLTPTCPYSEVYQKKIQSLCQALIDMGCNAIYVDQIGQLAPAECYDNTHGHKVGGGSWWQEGYRNMLLPVLEKNPGKIFFATENSAESYADSIQAYLTWTEVFRDDFPSLMQVYSGASLYFCNPSMEQDDLNSFCALQKRALLWGVQPGWMWWLHAMPAEKRDAGYQARLDYLNEIIALRRIFRSYYNYGELLDEVRFGEPTPETTIIWNRQGYDEFRAPAISGTIWRAADQKSLAVLIANVTDSAIQQTILLDMADYDVAGESFELWRVATDGSEELLQKFSGEQIAVPVSIPSHGFCTLQVKVVP